MARDTLTMAELLPSKTLGTRKLSTHISKWPPILQPRWPHRLSLLHEVAKVEGSAVTLDSSIACKVLKGSPGIAQCKRRDRQAHPATAEPSTFARIRYHLHTLHLFTSSDYKLVLFPQTAFGFVSALSGSFLAGNDTKPSILEVVGRLPFVLFWVYLNLLPFTIRNQSTPSAILEDALNKPHRPLPSGRLTKSAARRLTIISYGLAVMISVPPQTAAASLSLLLLGTIYNDFGGGDSSPLIRNVLNAAGHACFSLGAIMVASGSAALNMTLYRWIGIVMMVIATTIQVQDLPDQEGDAQRDRKTLPLTIGDSNTRWSVAVPVLFWSISVPKFWGVEVMAWAVVLSLGSLMAARILILRTVSDDRKTWLLWNVWMTMIFCLPLAKDLGF